MTERVGFIGLGKLGTPMVGRLLDNGRAVIGHDIREIGEEFQSCQIRFAKSPRAVADEAEIVLLCLPDADAVRRVCLGEEGLIHGDTVKVCVNLSTTGLRASQELAEALQGCSIAFIDCPVSGGVAAAREGRLTLIISGPEATVESLRPLLEIFGSNQFHVSNAIGAAQVLKLANNLLTAGNLVLAMEMMVCGAKAGLDPDLMLDVINTSSGRNSATEERIRDYVLTRRFDWGASIGTIEKDVKLMIEQAEELGVPVFVARQVHAMFALALARGEANSDMTSLIKHLENWADTTVMRNREDENTLVAQVERGKE